MFEDVQWPFSYLEESPVPSCSCHYLPILSISYRLFCTFSSPFLFMMFSCNIFSSCFLLPPSNSHFLLFSYSAFTVLYFDSGELSRYMAELRFPAEARNFSLHSIPAGSGAQSQGLFLRDEVDQSHAFSTKVKNGGAVPSLLHASSCRGA
jgi:hypothetical protein